MRTPLTKEHLWENLVQLTKRTREIRSLTGQKRHLIKKLNYNDKSYRIEYAETGNQKTVKLDDLFAMYTELYANGFLNTGYMGKAYKRILPWGGWTAPGSAMLAILPHLDPQIRADKGTIMV